MGRKEDRRAWFLVQAGKVVKAMQENGFSMMCYEFYRTPEDQLIKYHSGKSQVPYGLHQIWLAMDLVHVTDSGLNWKNGQVYVELSLQAMAHGLVTGRKWKKLPDATHLEDPKGWEFIPKSKRRKGL